MMLSVLITITTTMIPLYKEARLSQQIDHPDYTHMRVDLADRAVIANFAK